MKVTIEVCAGPNHGRPAKHDMDKNIDALERAINDKKLSSDDVLLLDTKSILQAIREKL